MLIAEEKKKTNIVEYVIYMYQIEDIIRSLSFNIETIEQFIISEFEQSADVKQQIKNWYISLIQQMGSENTKTKGHLKFLQNINKEIHSLHSKLIGSEQSAEYKNIYQKAEPILKELTLKAKNERFNNEIDVALHGIYGLLNLKLKKKEISKETQEAMSMISLWLAHLANAYKNQTPSSSTNFNLN